MMPVRSSTYIAPASNSRRTPSVLSSLYLEREMVDVSMLLTSDSRRGGRKQVQYLSLFPEIPDSNAQTASYSEPSSRARRGQPDSQRTQGSGIYLSGQREPCGSAGKRLFLCYCTVNYVSIDCRSVSSSQVNPNSGETENQTQSHHPFQKGPRQSCEGGLSSDAGPEGEGDSVNGAVQWP